MGCYNTTVVPASVDEVWAAFSNFHDVGWAPDVVTSLEVVGEAAGGTVGASRVLNGVFHETLRMVDADNRTIEYGVDDGPDAVSRDNVQGYIGKV